MKTTLLIALIIVLASSQCPNWNEFKEKFGKVYSDEAAERQGEAAYQQNARRVAEHNADPNSSFTMNCNQFSDKTQSQVRQSFGLNKPLKYVKTGNPSKPKTLKGTKLGAIPAEVDWRVEGIITPIKNQGSCGSCWAFTSTAYIEASYVHYNSTTYGNTTTDFSEEYALQCTTQNSPGSTVSDCGGGILQYAIPFLLRTGMPTETSYPYAAGTWTANTAGTPTSTGICSTTALVKDANFNPTFNTNYQNLTNADMKDTLAYNPLTGAMYAGGTFMSYSGGVYTGCPSFATSVGQLNHAVLIVGYTAAGDYIIKNSWGTSWGQNGYAIISAANDCGLSHIPRQIRGPNAQLTFERTIFLTFVFFIAFFLL